MTFERPERSMEELRAELLRYGGRLRELTLTRNRISMASVRFDAKGDARLRLHVAFLAAPDDVITALGRYLVKRSRHEWMVVKRYVEGMGIKDRRLATGDHGPHADLGCSSRCPQRRSQEFAAGDSGYYRPNAGDTLTPTLSPQGRGERVDGSLLLNARGRVYDLGAIFDAVNQRYFNGKVVCEIGWGRRGTAKRGARSRMIRFGSYSRMENAIRVNPMLDNAGVAQEFVEYIVFHEMLHAALPSVESGGRRAHHHRAYRLLERRFPGHARMQKMAVELVGKLRGLDVTELVVGDDHFECGSQSSPELERFNSNTPRPDSLPQG